MIAYLDGKLVTKRPTEAIVEVGGVGMRCRISLTTYADLPSAGAGVRILTRMVVREDGMDLYGFSSEAERTLFGLLQGVSGVGPRMAQGVLSGLSAREFARALAVEDLAALTSIKGVGRKTAERLILELKDKLPELEEVTGEPLPEGAEEEPVSDEDEAVLALRSLGYAPADAQRAVRRALEGLEGEAGVEAVVKRALTLTR
ncbi:MAG: Holliday junction branch migration protein RuvA [bacterium]